MAGRRILRQVWRRGARWRDSTSFSTRAIAPACDISIDRGAPFGSRVFELWRGYSSVGTSKQRQCWSCGAAAQAEVFMLCPACKIIQPANRSVNFFDIFDLKKEFELDTGELEKRYKNLQKKLHPDLYSMKSSKEQEYSADQSSQVINAYQVLLKPLSRATYLLETFGVDVEEEGTVTDPEILMEVMEMQETISSCSDSNKLQALKEKVRQIVGFLKLTSIFIFWITGILENARVPENFRGSNEEKRSRRCERSRAAHVLLPPDHQHDHSKTISPFSRQAMQQEKEKLQDKANARTDSGTGRTAATSASSCECSIRLFLRLR
ncbi:uncharacterized protein LOC9659858 isoform X2 [Selaginella moellendorffii]|uniref:uncharacterized protein LOC9659858 isoform X2 n=1 Tax=Selaginella moellendorffii TaxID=88036 RepID=UPI000D1D10BC|nr:uncharacterized protein LOC9659858 isoform X2 [Selaginella moellendorffii]|eukprot:XP_024516261.1 uncharacterized protein LOC9659858 isoform X2 [Selaginella moellendorffii]